MVEGLYVIKVIEESAADKAEEIRIGDRIIAVNNINIETYDMKQVDLLFQELLLLDEITFHLHHVGLPPKYSIIHIYRETSSDPLGVSLIGGISSPFTINSVTYSGIYIS
ncbi:MAG: hypothetical protein MHPSP_003950, partial [Paramarteilia canceri]